MFWRTALAASLLAWRAHAGVGGMMAEAHLARRTSADLERMLLLAVDGPDSATHAYPEVLSRRQAAGGQQQQQQRPAKAGATPAETSSGVVLNPDGTINMTAWEELANSACNDALLRLPESSNPSGTCICYNLPALDRNTGAFEADLRLYQLTTPSGEFSGVPPQNIMVGLSYRGASVSPVTPQTAQKLVATRQAAANPTASNATVASPGANGALTLLQTYLFVGQIDADRMEKDMTSAQLEALVMPVLTLSAVNSTGQTIATNVSSNEAAFVAGVFSREVFMSEFAIASKAVDDILASMKLDPAAPGAVAFVLPGVSIMIFPIGAIITGTWFVIGFVVIGFGYYERMSYRDQFRRRRGKVG